MFTSANIKNIKRCAFCVNWYDPANSHIRPKKPNLNLWEFDTSAKCMCLKKGVERPSTQLCSDYNCKVPIY